LISKRGLAKWIGFIGSRNADCNENLLVVKKRFAELARDVSSVVKSNKTTGRVLKRSGEPSRREGEASEGRRGRDRNRHRRSHANQPQL